MPPRPDLSFYALVAMLLERGLHANEISALTGRGESAVSKARRAAITRGMLTPPRFVPHESGIALARIRELQAEVDRLCAMNEAGIDPKQLEADLAGLLRGAIPSAVQVKVITGSTERTGREPYSRFASQLAPCLLHLLRQSQTIGCTWGTQLYMCSLAIVALAEQQEGRKPTGPGCRVLPLVGDILGMEKLRYSSSKIAEALNDALNGHSPVDRFHLTGVPAFLPECLRSLHDIGRWLAMSRDYVRIFGQFSPLDTSASAPKPLVDQLDVVLTSLSRFGQPWGFGPGVSRAALPEAHARDKTPLVAGDIGGVPILRDDLDIRKYRHDVDRFTRLFDQRWTGLKSHHLETLCASPRNSSDTTACRSVIAIVDHPDKARTALLAIKAGLANSLALSADAATRLRHLLEQRGCG